MSNNKNTDINDNFKTTFISTLKTSCENSTSHGIPPLFRTKSWIIRIFWIILFLGALAGGIYFICKSLITYYEYGVTISVDFIEELPSTTFPAVTICNLNAFDSSNQMVNTELNNLVANFSINTNINTNSSQPITQIKLILDQFKVISKSRDNENKKNQNVKNYDLGFDINKMIISCDFNGETCSSSNFVKSYSFEYVNCYTFNKNTGKSLKTVSQRKTGLTLELFAGLEANYTFERGIYVAIHNNSFQPLTKYDGCKIPVGYSTDIAVSRLFHYKLSTPFSDCRKDVTKYSSTDSTYFKYILDSLNYTTYSKTLCYEVCYQDLVNKNCACTDPTNIITLDYSIPICSSTVLNKCANSIIKNCIKSDTSCSCYSACPMECDFIEYATSLSSSAYPSLYYYNIMKQKSTVLDLFSGQNLSYDLYKNSVAMLSVYYTNLVYTNTSESPSYEPSDLVGIIGGELGLFIGVSLLSFCEILEFWIDFLEKYFDNKKKIFTTNQLK